MGLLHIKATPKGAISKADAIEYVGGPEFFDELVRDHQLCPCRKLGTRHLYRVQELDRCMRAAEELLRAEIFHKGNQPRQRKGEGQ